MWSAPPSADANLRQGDLLDDVPFAIVGGEPHVDDHSLAAVKIKRRKGLVISQCCTIESGGIVTVAQIISTKQLAAGEAYRQGLLNTEWPPVRGENVVTSAFPLDPIDPHLVPKHPDKLFTADLRLTTTYSGDLAWLQGRRLAQMTPEGRRRLRQRLILHWGREEPEDGAILRRLGLEPEFGT